MFDSSLTAIPRVCLRILIGVLDAIHNQMIIHKNFLPKRRARCSIHLALLFGRCCFISLIAQAIQVAIACHSPAGREMRDIEVAIACHSPAGREMRDIVAWVACHSFAGREMWDIEIAIACHSPAGREMWDRERKARLSSLQEQVNNYSKMTNMQMR
jgi:hypothetical protein